tara:strand:- start:4 stop:195 length:192 start_codon:yes stop_codon:yes gene_type:complete
VRERLKQGKRELPREISDEKIFLISFFKSAPVISQNDRVFVDKNHRLVEVSKKKKKEKERVDF